MTKLTWALAVAFLITSITLTIVAAQNAAGTSVLDGTDLLPPTTQEAPLVPDAPLAPPRSE